MSASRRKFGSALNSLQRMSGSPPRTKKQNCCKKEILPGAHSAYDAATKGFELGKFSFLDVLDAQRTLFQAKSQYLRALVETYRTELRSNVLSELANRRNDHEKI